MSDQDKWPESSALFAGSELSVKDAVYDYLFKKFVKAGERREAITVSERFLTNIQESRKSENYYDQIGIFQYYLDFRK